MSTLFISDIHLGAEHPEISERFCRALEQQTDGVEALYILGDLFEVWIGDDADQQEHQEALTTLKRLTDGGLPVFVMHGNRDFLLGRQFEQGTGCRLIADSLVIDLYGTPTLLMHGDTLCTDDTDYQNFRTQVRDPQWQAAFLSQPVEARAAYARKARETSMARGQSKPQAIMDVNHDAVITAMNDYGVTQLIHGHTHRPAVHKIELDGGEARRIVLGDWYQQESLLVCDESGCRLSGVN